MIDNIMDRLEVLAQLGYHIDVRNRNNMILIHGLFTIKGFTNLTTAIHTAEELAYTNGWKPVNL